MLINSNKSREKFILSSIFVVIVVDNDSSYSKSQTKTGINSMTFERNNNILLLFDRMSQRLNTVGILTCIRTDGYKNRTSFGMLDHCKKQSTQSDTAEPIKLPSIPLIPKIRTEHYIETAILFSIKRQKSSRPYKNYRILIGDLR